MQQLCQMQQRENMLKLLSGTLFCQHSAGNHSYQGLPLEVFHRLKMLPVTFPYWRVSRVLSSFLSNRDNSTHWFSRYQLTRSRSPRALCGRKGRGSWQLCLTSAMKYIVGLSSLSPEFIVFWCEVGCCAGYFPKDVFMPRLFGAFLFWSLEIVCGVNMIWTSPETTTRWSIDLLMDLEPQRSPTPLITHRKSNSVVFLDTWPKWWLRLGIPG